MNINIQAMMFRGLTACGVAILVGACASNSKAQEPDSIGDIPVSIQFDASGCPKKVTPEIFDVDQGKRIVWQAVDKDGRNMDIRYEIYFDPFKGQPLKSDPKGRKKSPPFDRNAPATPPPKGIEYKYSIVGEECKDEPLDPRFRLRR
jgi:hypothetical protein